MKPRVLLVNPNRLTIPYPVFPLGLAVIERALSRADYTVSFWDAQADADTLAERLERFQPRYVGITLRNVDNVNSRDPVAYSPELAEAVQAIRAQTPAKIVLGGSGFSLFPEALLRRSGADFGIKGEGEAALPALLDALEAGAPLDDVPGLCQLVGDAYHENPLQPLAADQMGGAGYLNTPGAHYTASSGLLGIQTQRGCHHRCGYCVYPQLDGTRFRQRDVEAVCDEIEGALESGARYLFFVDSVFNSSDRHVRAICEAILRRELRFSWGSFLRPQRVSAELAALMREAGMRHAEFGSDSFADPTLKAYHKHLRWQDILTSHQNVARAGIQTCHFLILGGPGETPETLETTIARASELGQTTIFASIGMRIYPGTAVHEQAITECQVAVDQDFTQPCFYISPHLDRPTIEARLQQVYASDDRWIDQTDEASFAGMRERMLQRGRVGPLWEYFSIMKRMAR